VVVPTRSHYEDVVEILCKNHLRRTLGLVDGDLVEVRISIA
jgi:riboflavin kinase